MVTEQVLDSRRKEVPTIDQVTTVIWTPDMGKRMALVRMKMLKEQKEFAKTLGVTQAAISRIELGHLKVTESFTVESLKKLLEKHFSFVVFGTNPERYNAGVITRTYWDTRLRLRRKNVAKHSRSRILWRGLMKAVN